MIRPSKKNNWLASFFQKFYGQEGGFYFFFDSEVLMPKYNKTYPYLLSFLHPSVQAYYIIHKHHKWNAENIHLRTTNSDFYQVLPSQNSIETFLKKNYENKK